METSAKKSIDKETIETSTSNNTREETNKSPIVAKSLNTNVLSDGLMTNFLVPDYLDIRQNNVIALTYTSVFDEQS